MTDAVGDAYPKTVVLKDGAQLVLRLAAGDERAAAARLLAFAGVAPAAEDVLVLACDGAHPAAAAAIVRGADGPAVAVGIDPAYRGRRLGTWMLLDAVHLASALGAERLVARARADDGELLAALRRLDFAVDAGRSAGGALVLVKTLHAGWPDF